jgi:hypothetical protein
MLSAIVDLFWKIGAALFGWLHPVKPVAQEAVTQQQRVDADIVNQPDRSQAVKDLDNDSI